MHLLCVYLLTPYIVTPSVFFLIPSNFMSGSRSRSGLESGSLLTNWVDCMSGRLYVGSTLCRVDCMSNLLYVGSIDMSGRLYVRSTVWCQVDCMSGPLYSGSTICQVDYTWGRLYVGLTIWMSTEQNILVIF